MVTKSERPVLPENGKDIAINLLLLLTANIHFMSQTRPLRKKTEGSRQEEKQTTS